MTMIEREIFLSKLAVTTKSNFERRRMIDEREEIGAPVFVFNK